MMMMMIFGVELQNNKNSIQTFIVTSVTTNYIASYSGWFDDTKRVMLILSHTNNE